MKLDRFESKAEAIDYLISEGKFSKRSEAEKYLQKCVPQEKAYQKKIIDHLKKKYPKAYVWKAAAGPYSRGGVPDIIAVIDCRFYGFEVKRPYFGEASELQKDAIRKINAAGGFAGVVCFPEDVEKIIERSKA